MSALKHNHPTSRGFALVVTLSLMVLLAMLAVGLLSLSAVSLRSSSRALIQGEARANARLAMMVALGEAQKALGPDRSAAAPASMMLENPAEPHLAGVWESWTWDPTDAGAAPDYAKAKKDRFLGWLASDNLEPGRRRQAEFPQSGPGNPVTLVGAGSAVAGGADATKAGRAVAAEVRGGLTPVRVGSARGHGYAWAALQEDVKAHVQPGAGELPATREGLFATLFAPDESGLEPLTMAGNLGADRAKRQRAITTGSLSLAGGEVTVARQAFHHLSPYPLGVLSDAAQGGMRRDLTSEFENFATSPLKGKRLYNSKTSTTASGAEPWWDGLAEYYKLATRVKSLGGGGATPLVLSKTDLGPFTEIPTTPNPTNTVPKRPYLKPVLAKVDILFSLVTHRMEDSNEATLSVGSWNHGMIEAVRQKDPGREHCMAWLVFEPIISLWNPYNVPIQFPALSVGFEYLPIGLQVQEYVPWLNRVSSTGGLRSVVTTPSPGDYDYWWRLAAMNQGSGGGAAFNRGFFIRLQGTTTNGTPSSSAALKLDPGEIKIFTAHVPKNATWAQVKNSFMLERGNTSNYTGAGDILNNAGQGVIYTAGWNSRVGGFRVNRFHPGRATTSDFVVLRRDNTDRFKVQLRLRDNARQTPPEPGDWNQPDPDKDSPDGSKFSTKILLMTGDATFADFNNATPAKTIQSLTLNEKDFRKQCADGLFLEIPKGVSGADAFQAPTDTKGEGKIPFALLSLTAKTTHDMLHPTKGWLFGNPVTANATSDDNLAPYTVLPYEMSFREITGSNSFPMVDVDVTTGTRGYFGPGQTSERGLTAATMFTLPVEPMVSVGQFQSANLLSSDTLPRFNYPVGNSHAHPMIPPGLVKSGTRFDHSFALNWRLWDGFYFSSLSIGATVRAEQFAKGEVPLNSRLRYHALPGAATDEVIARMTDGDPLTRSRRVATHQMVSGPFNVNSTSVEAWRAVLAGLRNRAVPTRDGGERQLGYDTPFPRFLGTMTPGDEALAIGGGAGNGGAEAARAARWVGTHPLTDDQISALARHIVRQIQQRGKEDKAPILTLGEFVNRRPGPENGLHALKGLLQTAIEEANREAALYSMDDGDVIAVDPKKDPPANAAALNGGSTAEGSPAFLLQGDILQAIGSFLTTHTDTLRIRAYGCAGEGDHRAEAWCEAIIQRLPEYFDPTDAPEADPPKAAANLRFGRRFQLVSFRWLSRDEV
jgi:hypothetical protein